MLESFLFQLQQRRLCVNTAQVHMNDLRKEALDCIYDPLKGVNGWFKDAIEHYKYIQYIEELDSSIWDTISVPKWKIAQIEEWKKKESVSIGKSPNAAQLHRNGRKLIRQGFSIAKQYLNDYQQTLGVMEAQISFFKMCLSQIKQLSVVQGILPLLAMKMAGMVNEIENCMWVNFAPEDSNVEFDQFCRSLWDLQLLGEKSTWKDTVDVTISKPTLHSISKLDHIEQRTPAWYEIKKTVLSASELGALIPSHRDLGYPPKIQDMVIETELHVSANKNNNNDICSDYENEIALITRKIKGPPANGFNQPEFGGPLIFGTIFEQIVNNLFQQTMNVKTEEAGFLKHPVYSILAASADGYFYSAELDQICCLELKTPFQRKLHGKPSLQYYHQMQAQMAVLGLQTCFFSDAYITKITRRDFEAVSSTCISASDENPCSSCQKGGHCLGVFVKNNKTNQYTYASSSVRTPCDFKNWLKEQTSVIGEGDCQPIYYHVNNHYILKIKQDPDWVQKIVPLLWVTMVNITHFRDIV